ncbi:hypothetical protein KHA80_04380 [Anaerobacillus sp. HL2]|nr:hypothetical protein KHA80_04380 [Anaerobacillus sp. HL2]
MLRQKGKLQKGLRTMVVQIYVHTTRCLWPMKNMRQHFIQSGMELPLVRKNRW